MKTKALYTGSFDPLTNGHLNIIERAAKLYDELTIGIIVNPSKKCVFSLDERKDMIEESLRHLKNVRVDCFSGLLARYVNANGFNVVVRGLRATMDFEYEIQMAQMNAKMCIRDRRGRHPYPRHGFPHSDYHMLSDRYRKALQRRIFYRTRISQGA